MAEKSDTHGEQAISGSNINYSQIIKWTVYILLLNNWMLYGIEEWQMAQHTLRNGGSFLDWTTAFGTTLDEAAWFGLLFLFELETYALSDQAWTRSTRWFLVGFRGICYVFLAHTVFAWGSSYMDLRDLSPSGELGDLCQLSDQNISFTRNLEYTLIDDTNCTGLSEDSVFYMVDNSAITDAAGFEVEKKLAWVDLQDAVVWLLVILSIEIGIRSFSNLGLDGSSFLK